MLRISEFCRQVNPESQPYKGVCTPTPAIKQKNKRTLGFPCREKVKQGEVPWKDLSRETNLGWVEVGGVLGGASLSLPEKKSQSRPEGLTHTVLWEQGDLGHKCRLHLLPPALGGSRPLLPGLHPVRCALARGWSAGGQLLQLASIGPTVS